MLSRLSLELRIVFKKYSLFGYQAFSKKYSFTRNILMMPFGEVPTWNFVHFRFTIILKPFRGEIAQAIEAQCSYHMAIRTALAFMEAL